MKKKICLLICALIAVLGLVGCSGSSKGKEEYATDTMQATAETLVNAFSQMDDASFEQLKELENLSDFQLEFQMLQMGLNVSGESFLNIIRSWEAAEDECGNFVKNGDYSIEIKSKEIEISTLAEYEDRDATIAFSFNKNGMLESMDISAKYTTGEILTKAGLNTVLGMGTVFVVLIFLAFIISLMKYIPALLDGSFGKKNKSAVQITTETTETQPTVVAEEADDLELIAVITAAIAAQEGTSTDGFVVRSIRRRPSNNWI